MLPKYNVANKRFKDKVLGARGWVGLGIIESNYGAEKEINAVLANTRHWSDSYVERNTAVALLPLRSYMLRSYILRS